MPSTRRSTLAFASLAVSLCLVFTAFAQDPQPKIIRKSGGVFQGSATRRVEPAYPPLAKAAQVSGSVVVEVTVDEEGGVISARAISGHPLLKDAAVTAAQGWRFSQTKLEGVPVKVIGTITFNFNLDDPKQLEVLEAQVRGNPGSPEAHFNLGHAYQMRGRADDAVAEFIAAVRIKPDYAMAYFELGQTYERLNRSDEALEAYRLALSIKPGLDSARNPKPALALQAYIFIAQFHYRRSEYREMLEVLRQAAGLYPDLDDLRIYIGQAHLELGDTQSALSEYNALKDKETEFAKKLLQQIEKKKP